MSTRKITMTGDELKVLHDSVNQGEPQKGLNIKEIRELIPIVDKLEINAEKKQIFNQGQPIQMLTFKETTIELKESEYNICVSKLENSSGWVNVDYGRRVVALLDRIKEIPPILEKDSVKGEAN